MKNNRKIKIVFTGRMVAAKVVMEEIPKSVIDAEAAVLPVIMTEWVGCRDTVEEDYNGFLVPPHVPAPWQ